MIIHKRELVRKYSAELLKTKVNVNKRVYLNRPAPVFFNAEMPCILVHFNTEPVQDVVGDKYHQKEIQRNMRLSVDVLTADTVQRDINDQPNSTAEDEADRISAQIERAFFSDPYFGKALPDYDPEKIDGLIFGLRLISTDPYTPEQDSDRRFLIMRNTFELYYETPGYIDYRFVDFDNYNIKINRSGWDEETVDPTLLEAEGEI